MRVSSRHHLRSDEVRELTAALSETVGVEVDADSYELVELTDADFDVVLLDGEPHVWYVADGDRREPFLTVIGANAFPPEGHVVTVDTGAISFVSDGADVMRPGITDADEDIAAGDLVVVTEESHGKALAIGRALVDGEDMLGDSGKVVESLHHVGDELFTFSV